MSYRDDDDPFEEDIVFDQAGLLSTSRKSSKSAIRRVSSGKCAMFSKTLGLCGAFLGLGLTCAIPGPLSPVPPSELRSDITLMTYEVMYRCQGFMIGAMFGARLLDRFNRLFLVFLALLVTALLVTIIPWCGIVWLLRTDMFLLGVSFGFLTTGGNVLCLDLWGRNSGPFMQALHFSFSLGVFLAPLLSQPLMAPVNYSVVVPSTTPAMFPLHRLPRDVGNLSSIGVGLPSAHLNLSMAANKAELKLLSKAPNTSSSDFVLTSSKAMLQTSTVSPLASQAAVTVLSLQTNQSHKVSVPPSTTASSVLSNVSEAVISSKLDVSTTTHRAPRPKPDVVNSDKLQDNENERFRHPPPEDLVPVSTTMKAMVRPGNTTTSTVNIVSTPATHVPVSLSNRTSTLNGTSSSTKQILSRLNNSTSPDLKHLSSPATLPSTISMNHSTESALLFSSTMDPIKALITKNIKLEANSSAHPTVPSTSALPTLNLPQDAALNLHTNSSNRSSKSSNYLEKSSVGSRKKELVPDISSTSGSLLSKEDLVSPSSVKVLPSVTSNSKSYNDSHGYAKSISLGEQEMSAPSIEEITKSTASSSRIKESKPASSYNTGSKEQVPTTVPHPHVKPNHQEKTPLVTQKSFGGSHVKAILDAKSNPASGEDHGTQPVRPRIEQVAKPLGTSATKYNRADVNNATMPVKNSSQVAESHILAEQTLGPRHTHHSKPASTVVNDTEVIHTVIDAFANRLEKYGLSRMELMYLTVGMVLLATSLLFLGFLCFNPRDPKSKTDEEEMNNHAARGSSSSRTRSSSGQSVVLPSRWLRHTLMGLMILLLMVTSGVQAMYGQLLMAFATQPPLQLSQSTGSALTATFWGALTSTRFACILLASALSPTAMLVLSVAICSCATWLLSAFASSSEVALWIGSVMVSVGTASVFPSCLLWMQRHVLITHRVAAMLVMGPAMGEMFFPTLAYKMMVSMGPASLIHLPALLSLVAIALWAATWRLARYPRQSLCSHVDESSGYQLANQHDEDDLLDLTMSPIVNGTGAIPRNSVRSSASAHSVHRMNA